MSTREPQIGEIWVIEFQGKPGAVGTTYVAELTSKGWRDFDTLLTDGATPVRRVGFAASGREVEEEPQAPLRFPDAAPVMLDNETGVVYVNGKPIESLVGEDIEILGLKYGEIIGVRLTILASRITISGDES